MNISFLPNEVLVDIIGRLDIDSIESVRLIDTRFKAVVRRHKLYKPVAESIKFSSFPEDDGHVLTVTASLAPKNHPMREKSFSCYISEEDNINKNLTELVKKFGLYRTKSIDITEAFDLEFDIFEVLRKAEIGLEELETCYTLKTLQTPFVTKEFMNKLVARNPRQICFRNCTTKLEFFDILDHLKHNLEDMPFNSSWQFGFCDTTGWAFDEVWRQVYQRGISIGQIKEKEFTFNKMSATFTIQHSN